MPTNTEYMRQLVLDNIINKKAHEVFNIPDGEEANYPNLAFAAELNKHVKEILGVPAALVDPIVERGAIINDLGNPRVSY